MKSIALAHVPTKGTLPRFTTEKLRLNAVSFSSLPEFVEWEEANSEWVNECDREDHAALVPGDASFTVPGYCAICDGTADFVVSSDYAGFAEARVYAYHSREFGHLVGLQKLISAVRV